MIDFPIEFRHIPIGKVAPNIGQLEGVPANPRSWTKEEMRLLQKSLVETPELFEMRPIIAYPLGQTFVALGGNMRLEASKRNKLKEVPCIVVPKETSVDKQIEIVIKDNGAFGEWDYDELGNNWDDKPLTEWGVPAWEPDEEEEEPQPKKPKEDDLSLTITFPDADRREQFLNQYRDMLLKDYECKLN